MKGKKLPGYFCWWLRYQFTHVGSLERYARNQTGYRPVRRDPTLRPPPSYTRTQADDVYGDAFSRVFKYLVTTNDGDLYEFGTYCGFTARLIALHMIKCHIQGTLRLFDSFIGLPEPTGKDLSSYEVANQIWTRGQMNVGDRTLALIQTSLGRILPPERLVFTQGYFDRTLPKLDRVHLRRAILLHLDCDLYESTICVLRYFLQSGLVADGAVMMCDDYNCNRAHPNMGQRLALTDAVREFPRYSFSTWFSYGWHGQAFFVHDLEAKTVV